MLMFGCSTKKNTVVTRTFHNINSRFNGFYWATESVKDGVAKIEKSNVDDYSRILPVFIYTDPKNAKSVYSEMDKAILKSSLVIHRHTITDKSGVIIPEAVKWIDDNYMLIGKAHFYKHDFFSGLEMFEYVAKEFKKQPSRYDAMLWMIRSYNEIGSFSLAEPLIDFLNNDKNFPKEMEAEFGAVSADYYLKLENYPMAIKYLIKASTQTKRKKARVRYCFILAQVYQQQKDFKKAIKNYEQVIKMNPPYEMAFNAIMNRARIHEIKSDEGKKIKKELKKMLVDFKNQEYQDQIYYALAEVVEKEGDTPGMIDYLNKSIKASVANNSQKALSYLKLADHNFDLPDYRLAEAYYDSTIKVMDPLHPNYEFIVNKKKCLSSLVLNLNTISTEDSLQRLASMSENAISKVIVDLIANVEIEEKKRKEEKDKPKEQNNSPFSQSNNPSTPNAPDAGGQWYFYNVATLSFGYTEFLKKWGNRKLEDNWRRSSKESVQAVAVQPDQQEVALDTLEKEVAKVGSDDIKNKEFYLKNIPFTPGQLLKSNIKIVDAYNNLGTIYKEQLINNVKAVEAFEELLNRYPDNKYKLSLYYQLYLLNIAMENTVRADYYRNILLNKYPETEYAKILKSPDYNKQKLANKNEIEQYYTNTYQKYKEAQYAEVIRNCSFADSVYTRNPLTPKFDYLRALAIGNTQDVKAFEGALTQIIIKNLKNEVKDKAQELLDIIKKQKEEKANPGSVAVENLVDTAVAKQTYVYNQDANYYWILLVGNKKGDVNKFKIALSDLNKEYFGSANLNINSTFLDEENQLMSVQSFTGKERAMNYFDFVKGSGDVFKDLEANSYQDFVISSENYSLFYQEKNIKKYLAFFKEKFLKK